MRIAFFGTEYPTPESPAGGMANFLRRVTQTMTAASEDVELFFSGRHSRDFFDDNVMIHEVANEQRLYQRLLRTSLLWRWADRMPWIDRSWSLYRAFLARHREKPFDVIHTAGNMGCGLWAAWRKPVPVVTRLSSYAPLCREANRLPNNKMQRHRERLEVSQLRRSSACYAPSRFVAEVIRRTHHIDVDVIEPPIDIDPTEYDGNDNPAELDANAYGLFFGTLGYLKGCDRLVRVLPLLLDQQDDFRFVFAGPANANNEVDGKSFDQFVRDTFSDHRNRVLVLPSQQRDDLYRLVAGARLVALPSRVDNLPNTCLEAMALGRVVVATRDASFEQLIEDGKSGLLVAQDDDAALTEAIQKAWCMSAEDRDAMGRRAGDVIERMRPNRAVGRLLEYLEDKAAFGKRARSDDSRISFR